MLFTITRDQYQTYGENANICRRYITEHFPKLCSTVNTFNHYFGSERVDIGGQQFKERSLLLATLEYYEQVHPEHGFPFTDYLESVLEDESSRHDRNGIFTDLCIYVWWPSVTVTNERGQSTLVTDLYAKVPICPDGRLWERCTLSRASYTYEQYISGYMHSHINGINHDPSYFQRPCLGSGPLNMTQNSLTSGNNGDLWDLFCVELDRYVQVESLAGVPYRHLDRIGTEQLHPLQLDGNRKTAFTPVIHNRELSDLIKRFFKYMIIRGKMRFAYSNGMFTMAWVSTESILNISKEFLKYYSLMKSAGKTTIETRFLLRNNILMEAKLNNNMLYGAGSTLSGTANYTAFNDLHVLYFKGEDIRTHVDSPASLTENSYYVLNPVIVNAFTDQCLNYLNIYEHEKNQNVIQEQTEISGGGSSHRDKNAFKDYPLGEKRVFLSV